VSRYGHDVESHSGVLKLVTQQELMGQLSGKAVQVVHDDGLHKSLAHEVTELGELRAVE
jgi:hypothetical protein